MGKDSFVFYLDWIDHLSMLEPVEAMSVLKAVQGYMNGTEITELSPAAAMAFKFIQAQVGRDMEKWDATCKKRAEAGRKGAQVTNERQKAANPANADFAEQNRQEAANPAVPEPVPVPVPEPVPVPSKEGGGSRGSDKPTSRFIPPSVDAVRAYCYERGNSVDAVAFVDFYTANGWKQGKGKPIVDWKAAVRTWERRDQRGSPAKEPRKTMRRFVDENGNEVAGYD